MLYYADELPEAADASHPVGIRLDKRRSRTLDPVGSMPANPPLTRGQFQPVALNGLGDPANGYVHCMQWFQGRLYVGLTRFVYHALRPYDTSRDFSMFPVRVSTMMWDNDLRAQIWRFDPASGIWEQVHRSPWCMGSQGFAVPRHIGFRDMAVFQGESDAAPALYATSWGSHMGLGPFVLRSVDGTSFEEVGAGDRTILGNQTLRALRPFKGRLFTVTTGRDSGLGGGQQQALVLVNRDPARAPWRPASEFGFGDPRNVAVFDLAVFDDRLYAGTMNPYNGFEVWCTHAEGDPPYTWERVIERGAYRGRSNEVAVSFAAFRDSLYVGSGIYAGGFDRIYNVGPDRPELIRLNRDGSWDLVVGNPRQTPIGFKIPTSGLAPGFNNPFAGYVWRLGVHQDCLYAGTCVWSPWIPFTNRDRWPDELRGVLSQQAEEQMMDEYGGCDLWSTSDGDQWQPVTLNGFDNRYNSGVRAICSTPYGVFVGLVNQFGPKVAVPRIAGWRYEWNRRGGAEVWLGRREPLDVKPTIADPNRDLMDHPDSTAARRRAAEDIDPLSPFFEHTGWRQCGFWRGGVRSVAEACQNLVREVLAFARSDETLRIPTVPTQAEIEAWKNTRSPWPYDDSAAVAPIEPVSGDVLGFEWSEGELTAELRDSFEPGRVVVTSDDRHLLRCCRQRFPDVSSRPSRLPRLRFSNDRFDRVVCIEGPSCQGQRTAMLREILRVLRPGGQLIGSDAVGEELDAKGYRDHLREVGFERVRVEDVTEVSLTEFRGRLMLFLSDRVAAGVLEPSEARRMTARIPAASEGARRYLLLSGYRPNPGR